MNPESYQEGGNMKQDNMNQKKISQEYEKAIQYIYELMKSGEPNSQEKCS